VTPVPETMMLGSSIGNYVVVGKIGQGGMGAVYRAVHHQLDRSMAVKVMLPRTAARRDGAVSLLNEARRAASVRHPGVVAIHDFGYLQDRIPYIMMEYLQGSSLAQQLRRVPAVPMGCALQIARAVASALHAVHEQGIVHRDLKPGNIFLLSQPVPPDDQRVKLLDFGLATSGVAGCTTAFARGSLVGTVPYMAPEQVRATAPVDRRADLYALGCVLYEMICGALPFSARHLEEVMTQHLHVQPVAPRVHDPEIPRALEALILWLLEKDASDRPATAAQLVAAIDELDASGMSAVPRSRAPVPEPYNGAARRPGSRCHRRTRARSLARHVIEIPAQGNTLNSEIGADSRSRRVGSVATESWAGSDAIQAARP
jgi:eukaryotic-like serine/threonine-protein kinase